MRYTRQVAYSVHQIRPIEDEVQRLRLELNRFLRVLSNEPTQGRGWDMGHDQACDAEKKVWADGVECVDGVVEVRPHKGWEVKRLELGLAHPRQGQSPRCCMTMDNQVLTRQRMYPSSLSSCISLDFVSHGCGLEVSLGA